MKHITKSATVFAADGYIQNLGVTVIDHGDTVSIGATNHAKEDLIITPTNIMSRIAEPTWEVAW